MCVSSVVVFPWSPQYVLWFPWFCCDQKHPDAMFLFGPRSLRNSRWLGLEPQWTMVGRSQWMPVVILLLVWCPYSLGILWDCSLSYGWFDNVWYCFTHPTQSVVCSKDLKVFKEICKEATYPSRDAGHKHGQMWVDCPIYCLNFVQPGRLLRQKISKSVGGYYFECSTFTPGISPWGT